MSNRKADNLLLFKSIVDAGSLSTAAKIENMSVSQVSKRMTYLEHSLGLQLLQRSTRKLSLTAAGEVLYKKLTSIKEQIDEAWESLLEYGDEPRGDLKIAAPITFGTNQLIPIIKIFKENYPKVNVNFELINREQPLEESSFDIHFESHTMAPGQLIPDSNFCARKVESEPLVFVASQDYIKQYGIPKSPEELNQHKCLTIYGQKQWSFYQGDQTISQTVEIEFSTNNFKSLHHAAMAGLGIALIPKSLYDQSADELVILFDNYKTDTLDTYAYYQPSQMTSKKVNLFLQQMQSRK